MKTYIYMKNGKITASGRTTDNSDCISAIGRSPYADEIVGCGKNKKEAEQDALESYIEGL